LIAIVAMLGLAVELAHTSTADDTVTAPATAAEASKFILDKLEYLRTSRPTAVNLFNACDEMGQLGIVSLYIYIPTIMLIT
jgi:methylthioribose-1-phosphate isomerase